MEVLTDLLYTLLFIWLSAVFVLFLISFIIIIAHGMVIFIMDQLRDIGIKPRSRQ